MEPLPIRPGWRFANGYMRQAAHGAFLHAHLDRAPLDVAMSIPILCEDADGWPLWVEQPNGMGLRPGDGTAFRAGMKWRDRRHGRDAGKMLFGRSTLGKGHPAGIEAFAIRRWA